MTAKEALEITNANSFKTDAVAYGIMKTENAIKSAAEKGKRACDVDFYHFPGEYKKFEEKYGAEKRDSYKQYDVEKEIRDYFADNGFTFKKVTDLVLGGVRQDPFWEIHW